jgi:F0F1-type ATP synthase membrane subunit b/b'
LTTFLFELVNFLILAGALGWFLFTPIRTALEARKAAEEKRMQETEARLAAAERAKAEIANERRKLEEERDRMLKDAENAAAKRAERLLNDARDKADRERGEADRELAAISEAQLEKLASASAGAAAIVMEKLLALVDAPDLQRQFVNAACRELRSIADRLSGSVIVESAKDVDADAAASLNAALGNKVSAEYRVHPELGAGIRIETNIGVIDFTASGLAVYAKRELQNRLLADARSSGRADSEVHTS